MGHIATKFTGLTSIGTSTADTLLGGAAIELPDGAREILGIIPYLTSPAGNTAAEAVNANIFITSDDLKIVPFHCPANPIGSSLLKSVAQVQGKSQFYPIHCPCKGGESLKIYGAALQAHTIAPYAGALIVYTDEPTGLPQVYSKVGTLTSTGTAAARVSCGTISIVGGRRLIEVAGYAFGTTVAALKGLAGHFDIQSEGFTPAWQIDLPIEMISGQVDTNIQECIAGVARKEVSIDLKDKSTLNIGFTLAAALTTTGKAVAYAFWN
jgi:hypothetical protein